MIVGTSYIICLIVYISYNWHKPLDYMFSHYHMQLLLWIIGDFLSNTTTHYGFFDWSKETTIVLFYYNCNYLVIKTTM